MCIMNCIWPDIYVLYRVCFLFQRSRYFSFVFTFFPHSIFDMYILSLIFDWLRRCDCQRLLCTHNTHTPYPSNAEPIGPCSKWSKTENFQLTHTHTKDTRMSHFRNKIKQIEHGTQNASFHYDVLFCAYCTYLLSFVVVSYSVLLCCCCCCCSESEFLSVAFGFGSCYIHF